MNIKVVQCFCKCGITAITVTAKTILTSPAGTLPDGKAAISVDMRQSIKRVKCRFTWPLKITPSPVKSGFRWP